MNKTEQIKPLFEVDESGKLQLNFHPGQKKAWASDKQKVFVLAGTQSGKTSFGGWWLWREIKRCGSGDYLAVTANYDLFKLKMLPELLKIFVNTFHIGKYHASMRVIEICNEQGKFVKNPQTEQMWARIILRSARAGAKSGKEGASGLESATARSAVLDECGLFDFSLQAYEAVKRRLSLAEGRILGTSTLYNFGWLKTEIYDRWQNGDPNIDVIQFESIMNPAFPRSAFNEAYDTLPEWKFNLLYRGQYSKPAGMVYSDFNSAEHVVPDFGIPNTWKKFVGIDPGAINTALIWLAEDKGHNCFYLYRESLEGDLTTSEHVQKAKEHSGGVAMWVGGSASEKQFRMDWKDAGIDVEEPTITDVESGIDRVTSLLKEKRLFVFSSCRGILDEFGTYSRKLDERGEPTEAIQNKERFHRLDALRYIVSGILGTKPESSPVVTSYFIPRLESSHRIYPL